MTKSELSNAVQKISGDVLAKNHDALEKRISSFFPEGKSTYSVEDVTSTLVAMCLSISAEVSAAITADILLAFGLLTVDE